MPSRVRLTWNRNQDTDTDHYRVFRSTEPNINEQNKMEHLIMRVDHTNKVNPVQVENEIMKRFSSTIYLFEHKQILSFMEGIVFPLKIKVNDEYVSTFTLDTVEGRLIFDEEIDPTATVLAEKYVFDGVRVWDYAIEEPEKTYYGPEAKDTSAPDTPKNLTMYSDYEKNRVVLKWSASDVDGKKYYYQIDSAIDGVRYSRLSQRKVVIVKEPLADRPYVIERSLNGIKWQEIAKVKGNIFYEYMIDRQAPNPIQNLRGSAFLDMGNGLATVTLDWDRIVDNVSSNTPLYRVRSVNRVNVVSEPSNVVGPIPFKVELREIVVRRKVYDGTLPSFDGADAITAARTTDLSMVKFSENVDDNQKYIYAVYVTDAAGNVSPISYVTVEVGDATAPVVPLNVTAIPFQLIVG